MGQIENEETASVRTVEPVHRVATIDVILCSLCGGLIDLSAGDCRSAVEQAKVLLAGRGAQ
jgi:hypothetical protein